LKDASHHFGPAKRFLSLLARTTITVKREADHDALYALLLTDHRESCSVCTGVFRADHRWEAARRQVVNRYCETDSPIAEVNSESPAGPVHASAPDRVRPRAAAIA
jgi:hypothetical protein